MNEQLTCLDAELETMRDLVVRRLRNLYEVEHEIMQALPEIAEAVFAPHLRHAITAYLERTREQLQRLEQALALVGQPPRAMFVHAMDRLRHGRAQMMRQVGRDSVTDADIIEAARRVEHYEFTSFRAAQSCEKRWGQPRLTELLQEILEEERESDEKLAKLTGAVIKEM
jgi:ferritin-like metal-binding protein YciE